MLTKLEVRKIIDCAKDEYNKSGDKTILVNIAILKGLYIAMGGTKYINVPQKFNSMTTYASLVFKHKLNIKNKLSKDKITALLVKSLITIGKKPEIIIGTKIPMLNSDIVVLMLNLIFSEYTEDMTVKSLDIQCITLDLLQRIDEREVGD